MAETAAPGANPLRPPQGLALRLAGSARFRAFCARVPGLRWLAQREGAALFDLMQGFVQSQVLSALVELRILHRLAEAPASLPALAAGLDLPADRLRVLLQAGAAMKLLQRRSAETYVLAPRGAAFLSVPGLQALVAHHRVLYADLADPAAFFRGQTDPALARFWPYVFGAGQAADPGTAASYSRLMSDSQSVVAEETLRHLDLSRSGHLMDVGGGTGAFLRAVRARWPDLPLTLFDLPAVLAAANPPPGCALQAGSFRDDPLPTVADTISLVRVLYDHSDATVAALLGAVFAALPPCGRLIVSEPMGGGARPDPQTDVYFSVYTLAMQTGRTRAPAEIAALLAGAGFADIRLESRDFSFVTCVMTARKPLRA
ncbi:MAG: methyltransferase [Gemmobacter sp.]|uniref:methyltransferase n=1 Tax=Gemmobacter sp. TaxID=1898957 RepID=UPI00391C6E37